jgi:hypothetical protein
MTGVWMSATTNRPPREVPAKTKFEVEGQPSVGGDGGPVGREKVIVDTFLAP